MREHSQTRARPLLCMGVFMHLYVCSERDVQAAEPFTNTINRMNHLLRQLRRQQGFYFSTHGFCIMSQAARGMPLTILMVLAEAINDAVTEQWLDFKKMVVMLAGGGVWGHHLVSTMNLCAMLCPPANLHSNTRGE